MENSVRKYEQPGLQVIEGQENGAAGGGQYRRVEMRTCRSSLQGNGGRNTAGQGNIRPVQPERREGRVGQRAAAGSESLERSTGQRTGAGSGSRPAALKHRQEKGFRETAVRPADRRREYRRAGSGSRPATVRPADRRREYRKRERRRRARIRRRVVFVLWQVILVIAGGILFLNIKSGFDKMSRGKESDISAWREPVQQAVSDDAQEADHPSVWQKITDGWSGDGEQTYPDLCGLDEVDEPVKREPEEVLKRLRELGGEYEQIAAIMEHQEEYPDKMLEALANNPEMADFVAGYPTASHSVSGGLTETEKSQEYPLFLQWDPRWGYVSYGDDSNIGLAGCGPVSLSMAIYYLTGDASLTPDVFAKYAMENGYYMSGTGTAWALITDVPGRYGVRVTQPGVGEYQMKQELDRGRVIICAMRPGDFTASGHFIVIYGYDKDGFLVSDPNCVARSKKSWPYERIRYQIKQLWALGVS